MGTSLSLVRPRYRVSSFSSVLPSSGVAEGAGLVAFLPVVPIPVVLEGAPDPGSATAWSPEAVCASALALIPIPSARIENAGANFIRQTDYNGHALKSTGFIPT